MLMRKYYLTLTAALLAASATMAQAPKAGETTSAKNMERTPLAQNMERTPLAKSLERTLTNASALHKASGMKANAKAAARRAATDDIITTAPEGTVYKNMYHAGAGFIASWGDVYELATDGLADDVVVTDDGTVYMRNPITTFWSNTYIKGTRAQGDTIEVRLPQHIYHLDADEENGEEEQDMYLFKCSYQTVDDEGGSFFPTDDQTMKFVWRNDSLTMVNDTESSWLLGACNAEGGWYGYGDYVNSYSVLHAETVEPSTSATIQQASFSYVGDGVEDGSIGKMAFDGNNVYLAGIAPNQPDAWIKGTIEGDKATFEGAQYLGVDTVTESHVFFQPLRYDEVYVEEWDDYDLEYSFVPNLVMDYDATTQTLSSDTLFCINQGYRQLNQMVTYEDFSFKPWTEVAATPVNPEIEGYDDYFEDYGYGMFNFTLERYDQTAYLLDKDKLYYNIYLDDDVLTFEPDEYARIDESFTNVPFDYTDRYDLTNYTGRYTVTVYRSGFQKIGVQLVYTGGGETRKSDIVYYVLATGETEVVNGISNTSAAAATALSTTYTDLQGRRTNAPAKGIYIKTTRYNDGTVKSVKAVR